MSVSVTAAKTVESRTEPHHPIAPYLRMDRMPHIWCPTCGIGTVLKCYVTALENELGARPGQGRGRLGHRLHRTRGRAI